MIEHAATELPRHLITGREVSRLTSQTEAAQVELVSRQPDGPVRWKFRQSRAVLIWSRCAMERQTLKADESSVLQRARTLGSRLYVIPANATFEGEIEVKENFEYTMVFINKSVLGPTRWSCLDRFFAGNVSPEITRCLAGVSGEAAAPDNLFDLLAESWLIQTLAFLTRMTTTDKSTDSYRGGLASADRRRIEDYIQAHLANSIKLSDLARQVDLGERHFSRVFSQVFHETPVSYVIRLRIEKAKRLLATTKLTVTEIALECGFSHAQHFSTRFHDAVGTSPSRFRRIVLS